MPGPALFLAPTLMQSFDTNQDHSLSREEFAQGFTKCFNEWSKNSETLTPDQLRAGLNQLFRPLLNHLHASPLCSAALRARS